MATAMIYDTLKLAEQLEHEAGFDGPRARAMARILAENTGGDFATRGDIAKLATTTRGDIEKLAIATREDIAKLTTTTRGDIEKLAIATREDIAKLATTTREDIAKLATTTREDIAKVATATREEIAKLATKEEVRAEIQDLRNEVHDVRGDIRVLYWMTGTAIAGITGILGIAITMALHVMHLG